MDIDAKSILYTFNFLRIYYRAALRGISHAPQLNYELKSKRIFILGITQAR